MPWWEVFQDTILKNLITEALGNNYDVRIAAARVQEARANFVVSRSDLYPSLDYGAGVSRGKIEPGIVGGPGPPAPRASNFYYGTLTMSWDEVSALAPDEYLGWVLPFQGADRLGPGDRWERLPEASKPH